MLVAAQLMIVLTGENLENLVRLELEERSVLFKLSDLFQFIRQDIYWFIYLYDMISAGHES